MKRGVIIDKVETLGDAVVTYRSSVSKKLKYNVVTLDFSTKYIKNKVRRNEAKEDEIVFFSWDTDSFRRLKCSQIVSIEPVGGTNGNIPQSSK